MVDWARGFGDYIAAIAGGVGVALIAALIVLALSRVTFPTLRRLWHRAPPLGRLFGTLLFLICSINATTKADITYAAVDDLGAANNLLRSASGWRGSTWSTAGGGLEWALPTETVFGKCCWLPYFKGAPDLPYLSSSAFPSVFEGVLSDAVAGLGDSYEWRTDNDNLEIKSPNERETEVVHKDGTDWQSYNLAVTATLGEHKLTSMINGHFWTNSVVEEISLSVSAPKVLLLPSNAVKKGHDSGVVTINLKLPEGESGTLSLECVSGTGKIQLSGETSWEVEGSTIKEVSVIGQVGSDSKDDVCLIASFTPKDGTQVVRKISLTVVHVQHIADVQIPKDVLRNCFGILEKVRFVWEPADIAFSVECDNGNIIAKENGWCQIEVGAETGITTVRLETDILEADSTLNVVSPQDIVAVINESRFSDQPNLAGGIEIIFKITILPKEVSFSHLKVQEVPCVATDAVGYFAQAQHIGFLDHGKNGAGIWMSVRPDNTYFDAAGVRVLYPPWLEGGSFTWPIPCVWRYSDNDRYIIDYLTQYTQRFELDANGTVRIKKFGYCAERTTNNVPRIIIGTL